MSIIEIIKECCDRDDLFPIDPSISTDPIVRRLYVTAEIMEKLETFGSNEPAWGEARAAMDNYVTGGLISVGHTQKCFMAQLKPAEDGVWEMRATKPSPAIRILGQFAEKDLFIALEWGIRKDLGAFQSKEFKQIIRNCKVKWRGLFHPYSPLKGGYENDYVSHIVPIRNRKKQGTNP